ncbi:MAG: hypothetical protein WBG86_21720 [Polyangiales bacterium]
MRDRACDGALIILGAVACLGFSARADAQAIYYRSIPIGERAVGLGGAFTGVADDPSATYYNPAGIVRGGRFGLLGSFSSLVFSRRKISDAFTAPGQEETFTSKNSTSLPRFVGTTVKMGPKKFGDDHRFAVGYSTVEVARNRTNVGVAQNNAAATLDLRVDSDYASRWYGISFAAEATKRSSVGFTIFLSDQSLGYDENLGIATGGTFDAQTGTRIGGDSTTSSGEVRVSAYHFVPRLGWLHQIDSRWSVGVMLQTPGIPLKQKGKVLRRVTAADAGVDPVFFFFDEDKLKANMPVPFELRAGVGFQATSDTLVSLDFSVTGPLKDQPLFSDSAALAPINGELGVYLPSNTTRRWTPNFAVGAQHRFGKTVVAGGLFSNVSAAPSVPATSNQFVPAQVNLWGASVSVGLDTKGYRLTVGANGMFGKGKAAAADFDDSANVVSYQRTGETAGALILYIAGAISIATKTAALVKEKRTSKREQAPPEQADSPTGNGDAATRDP